MTCDIAMRRGVPIAGRVTGPDGPAVGARLVANWCDDSADRKTIVQVIGYADGDGRFSLDGVPCRTVVLQVFADGCYQDGLADYNWTSSFLNGKKPRGSIDVPPQGLTDLKIELKQGCVVSGRVETATGAPLSGASVACVWSSTTSADDGSFRLMVTPLSRDVEVAAAASPDFATTIKIAVSPGGHVDDVVLRMMPRIRVAGHVTAPSGVAVDGASVEVIMTPPKPFDTKPEWVFVRVPLHDGGRYEAEFAPRDAPFRVRASADGLGSAELKDVSIEVGRTTYQVDVALVARPSLDGRVVSTDGQTPVAGARLSLLPKYSELRNLGISRPPLAAVTGADGRFHVADVSVGDLVLYVDHDSFVRRTWPIHVPSAGEIIVKLEAPHEIAGIVSLADGRPFAEAWVCLRGEDKKRALSSDENFWSVPTEADGRFRATRLPAGTFTVSVGPPLHATIAVRRLELTGVPADKRDLEFIVEFSGEIAGRVLGPDGAPIAGCCVQAASETGDKFTPSAVTDVDGAFVIRGVEKGTYALTASPPEAERFANLLCCAQFLAARVTGVPVGSKDAAVRLTSGQSIRGTLVDAAGAPLADAWIRAELLPGQTVDLWQRPMFPGVCVRSEKDSAFAITGLPSARFRLVQVVDPFAGWAARPLRGGDDVNAGATGVRVVATE